MKHLLILFILLTNINLFSFEVIDTRGMGIPEYIELASLTIPYYEKYGEPEEIKKYEKVEYREYSGDVYNVQIVEWWYYSKGFEVAFIESKYNSVFGWEVESEYYFDPIKCKCYY